MPTYSELLRDPRWQKMRLKKLESAEWKCERCADADSTLNVHHKRYVKGRSPWEYDEAELVVLCEECHEGEHGSKEFRSELMARLWLDGPLSIDCFMAYGAGALSSFDWLVEEDETLLALLARARESQPLQYEVGRAGSALEQLGVGTFVFDADTMQHVADLISADEDFGRELLDLLRRHGVKVPDA